LTNCQIHKVQSQSLANTKYIKTQTSITKKFLISKKNLSIKITKETDNHYKLQGKWKDNLISKEIQESEKVKLLGLYLKPKDYYLFLKDSGKTNCNSSNPSYS